MLILNNKYFILLLPFLSFVLIALQFYILQFISKNRLNNFAISCISVSIVNFFYIYENILLISIFHIIFITLTSIMNIYIFLNLIQLPVSSIQINILRIINKKKITQIQLQKKYNDHKIFNLRFKRLLESNVFDYKNGKFLIKSKFVTLVLNIFLFLQKITIKK